MGPSSWQPSSAATRTRGRVAAYFVIAPRWGSEDGLERSQPSPLGWAEGARAFGPEGRRSFGVWELQCGITFPARGRLEARRGRSPSAQGNALGGRRKIDPKAA